MFNEKMEYKIYKQKLQDTGIAILPPGSKLENILEGVIGLDKNTTDKVSSEFDKSITVNGYIVWRTPSRERDKGNIVYAVCKEETIKALLEAYCRMV